MLDDRTPSSAPLSQSDETEYVGAPTEFADAQEAPGWVQDLVRVVVALPAAITALTAIELTLITALVICLALAVIALAAL